MKKKSTRLILILAFILLVPIGATAYHIYARYYQVSYEPEAYIEINTHLSNPYQGWYHIYGYTISDSEPIPVDNILAVGQGEDTPRIALIQVNLRNYSHQEISEAGLEQLDRLFDAWGQTDKQLLVRFLYDWDGKAKETEPDTFELVKTHMTQVSDSVNRHKNGIYLLQGIFVGNCGEMNNSNYMSKEHMEELVNHLAAITDPDIFLSVRTPAHWRIVSRKYTPLEDTQAFDGSVSSRLGLFNDGMLGSGNDLGTYGDKSLSLAEDFRDKGTREEEIAFQNTLCKYVPNGGEAVIENPYNDFEAAIADLSQMHVSYLNCDYDRAVLDKWQNNLYTGEGCFEGVNGYDYIGEHLGYRYSFLDSDCSFDTWKDENAAFSLTIENSGFSVSYRKFDSLVTLVNQSDESLTKIPLDSDNRFWTPGESVTISCPVEIRTLTPGSYQVFYSLTDPVTDRMIQFANNMNPSVHGYPVGTLTIAKQP